MGSGVAKFEGRGGMVGGVSAARTGVGEVVGVRVCRVAMMVLVRVMWIVDRDGRVRVWRSRDVMLALTRRVARDGDGGVCLVLGWLSWDCGV